MELLVIMTLVTWVVMALVAFLHHSDRDRDDD